MKVPLLGNLELKCESSRLKISRTVTQWLGSTSDQRLLLQARPKSIPMFIPPGKWLGFAIVPFNFATTGTKWDDPRSSAPPQRCVSFLPWGRNPGPTIPASQLSKPALEQRRRVLSAMSAGRHQESSNHPTKIVASLWFSGICVCVSAPSRFKAALQSRGETPLV